MKNQAMKEYWAGYRAAKTDNEECGFGYVKSCVSYGLQGKSRHYYDGYKKAYDRLHAAIKAFNNAHDGE